MTKTLTFQVGDQKIPFEPYHMELAKREKTLSDKALTADDFSRNIVLAQLTILIKDKSGEHHLVSVPITREGVVFKTDGKLAVFESGAAGSIFSEEVYTQTLQRQILQPLKEKSAPDLKSMTEVGDLERILQLIRKIQESYSQGTLNYKSQTKDYGFDVTAAKVEDVLKWIDFLYERPVSEPSRIIIKEFAKDKTAFSKKTAELLTQRSEGLELMAVFPKDATGITVNFLKDLSDKSLGLAKIIDRSEIDVNKITVKLFYTYWHSEQKLMKFLIENRERINEQIKEVLLRTGVGEVVSVFLNLHSKYDICNVCAPSFLQFSSIFEPMIQKAFSGAKFKVLTSFRETRTDYKESRLLGTETLSLDELMSRNEVLLTMKF